MLKVKTKSGFSCEINEKKVGSWNTVDLYTKISKASKANDLGTLMELTQSLYVFVLGEDGYNALIDHLKDDDGIVSVCSSSHDIKPPLNVAGNGSFPFGYIS